MISAGEFRKGVTFEYESGIYTIVDFQHVKPGKGSAFVRTKMKNVITGAVLEKTWNPTEKVQEAHIETKNMTYSYNDGELYYFIVQADPSVKGNTATNATKEAVLETGAKIQVPMFVQEGELIRVDTRTDEYMERVKG